MGLRIGLGTDLHRLSEGRKLFLGGISIPYYKGSVGHSDADVLIHAICDALLGALALRDIGWHFPDTDPAYKDVDSKILLKNVVKKVEEQGYHILNIDSVITLEKPRLSHYIPEICASIAEIIGIDVSQISVKAKTAEGTGDVGSGNAVSAMAVVIISK